MIRFLIETRWIVGAQVRAGQELADRICARIELKTRMSGIDFYVTILDAKGFLWMNSVGGFDTQPLLAA